MCIGNVCMCGVRNNMQQISAAKASILACVCIIEGGKKNQFGVNQNNENAIFWVKDMKKKDTTFLTQFLSSRASSRAYVIASHITPIVYDIFFATTPDHDEKEQIQQEIQADNTTTTSDDYTSSLHQFLSDDQVKLWLKLCEDDNDDNDDDDDDTTEQQLFRRFLVDHTAAAAAVNQLSQQQQQQQVVHLLKRTIKALDCKMIEPKHVPALNLQRTALSGYKTHLLLHSLIPKCCALMTVNLSHLASVVDDETMECLGRYLPHLKHVHVDYCDRVTDDGCKKMLQWMTQRATGNRMKRDKINIPSSSLHTLNLSHTGITEDGLRCLLNYLMTINQDYGSNDLSVLKCEGIHIGQHLAESLLNACQRLNKVHCGFNNDYNYSKFRDQVVLKLPNAKSASSTCSNNKFEMDLSNSLVTNDILKNVLSVYASPSLCKISLSNTPNINDSIVPIIQRFAKRMPNLESVDLDRTHLSEDSKQEILRCLNLWRQI